MIALPSPIKQHFKPPSQIKNQHCPRCWYRASKPRVLCSFHASKHRQYMQRERQKRKQTGQCICCPKPAASGYVACMDHVRLRAVDSGIRRFGHPSQRLTRWNPITPTLVFNLVHRESPYLDKDLETAKSFILKYYDLWLPHEETAWNRRIYLNDLSKNVRSAMG